MLWLVLFLHRRSNHPRCAARHRGFHQYRSRRCYRSLVSSIVSSPLSIGSCERSRRLSSCSFVSSPRQRRSCFFISTIFIIRVFNWPCVCVGVYVYVFVYVCDNIFARMGVRLNDEYLLRYCNNNKNNDNGVGH